MKDRIVKWGWAIVLAVALAAAPVGAQQKPPDPKPEPPQRTEPARERWERPKLERREPKRPGTTAPRGEVRSRPSDGSGGKQKPKPSTPPE